MKRFALLVLSGFVLATPASAQLPPEKALADLQPAEGLQVELFAAEPMLMNPTAIDVDPKGRVWVAEAVNYRRVNFNRPILREEGDRIVVLEDSNGDGQADKSHVFYQGKELYGPIGICVIPQADNKGYRVLVAQSPDILEFTDSNGDLKADGPPKKFLTGFRGFDHDHGVHGLSIGPDGKLYFTVGDSGVENLQSSDGKGRKWTSNNTDCRAGTIWRCDLDGTNLELIAHNFRNPYDATVNSFGEIWLSDNDDDGTEQTRICYVMPGGNYGYHPRGPGQSHWHEEQPGIVHKTLRTGFGSPTGITFYEGSLLPEKYRGQLLHCDAGPRELRCFQIKPKGAGYELEKELLLTSKTDNFFRLSDVCVAPDGSVFVADWYDRGVGGHGMGDPFDGRIYRLTPKGHKGYQVPDTGDDLMAALNSPNYATRALAQGRIKNLAEQELADLLRKTPIKELDIQLQGRMLALLASFMDPTYGLMFGIDSYRNEIQLKIREQTLRTTHTFFYRLPDEYKEEFYDKLGEIDGRVVKAPGFTLTVAREHLLLLSKFEDIETVKGNFYTFAKQYDGQDHFYRAALNIALGTDPKRRDTILADFDKQFPEWNDKVADLVWELRPKSMMPRMQELLADGKLGGPQKARIVDILAANDDSSAGQALLQLLTTDAPAEVKARAIDNLKLFLPTKWNGLTKGDELTRVVAQLLENNESRIHGLQLVAAARFNQAIPELRVMVTDDGTDNEVKAEAYRTLGSLNSPEAAKTLISAIEAAKTKAQTNQAVSALGGLLGRGQGEAAQLAMGRLGQIVLAKGSDADIRRTALGALASSRPGTDWLLKLKEEDKLPEFVSADAGRLLRNSPFQGQRNKAMLLFPAPGKLDPKKLPPIEELAKRNGDVSRGREVMAKSVSNEVQCMKCHMVRGSGGQIGPDLSMIGKKASIDNLYESILYPSKAIADQYITWVIDTIDGQTLSGLIVGESDTTLTLRDANGKDYDIPLDDIESRKKSLTSIMPENLIVGLTEDELVDLVTYLKTLQTPSYTPEDWQVIGPFPAKTMVEALNTEYGPEKGELDLTAKHPANGKELAWQPFRPDANGYLDLEALHRNGSNNTASYLTVRFHSPAAQQAVFLLGTDDGATLWLNGKQLFRTEATRAAAPEQERVTVQLQAGMNTVLFKIANGDGPTGAYFTVLSDQELTRTGSQDSTEGGK